jgi:hypothetical protein
LNQTQQLYLK